MRNLKLTEQDLTNIVKKVILEDEKPKKKLFIPRDIDKKREEYQEIIKKELDKVRNSPFGKLSKDSIFEWLQENNLDQELKLTYKGPSLGEVSMTSYNKNNGEVTLYFDGLLGVAIRYKISDIQVGYVRTDMENDDEFLPLN